jgi:hypothetical protein
MSLCLALVTSQVPNGSAPQPSGEKGPSEIAHALFGALVARDLDTLCQLTPAPFSFDGTEARSRDEVRRAWTRVLQRHTVSTRKLGATELVSYEDLVKRYGPPPDRLGSLPLAGSQAVIADLGGRPTILFLRKRGAAWVPFAVTD